MLGAVDDWLSGHESYARYLTRPTDSFWRSLRFLADARLVIAIVLVAYVPIFGPSLEGTKEAAATLGTLPFRVERFANISRVYLGFALAMSVLARRARGGFNLILFLQTVLDILLIGLLVRAGVGAMGGIGVLMLTPVAGAAILSRPMVALFFAALASLVLLGEAGMRFSTLSERQDSAATDGVLLQAALISAVLFFTVLIVNFLARRGLAQEALAIRRGEALARQQATNQRVIDEIDRGVLVFSRAGELRALNPKASMLVGGREPEGVLLSRLRELVKAGTSTGQESLVLEGADGDRRLRLRIIRAAVDAQDHEADRIVLLEDLAELESQAQQMKLASMGRLSASIAHEIRNPLGAIRHAGNLLSESLAEPTQRRLTTIIEANSVRIDRIVEGVLSIARRSGRAEDIALADFVGAFLAEFVEQGEGALDRIELRIDAHASVHFDPDHLRQILVNLLTNAMRYAGREPGAILVDVPEGCLLAVHDDGPGIPQAERQHLFEPFYTTDVRGTGLGLYMAQQLCATNRCVLRHEAELRGRHRSHFLIVPASERLAVPMPSLAPEGELP